MFSIIDKIKYKNTINAKDQTLNTRINPKLINKKTILISFPFHPKVFNLSENNGISEIINSPNKSIKAPIKNGLNKNKTNSLIFNPMLADRQNQWESHEE